MWFAAAFPAAGEERVGSCWTESGHEKGKVSDMGTDDKAIAVDKGSVGCSGSLFVSGGHTGHTESKDWLVCCTENQLLFVGG